MIKRYGPYKTKEGYLFYNYHDGGDSSHSVYIHRQVMEEALGRPLTKDEVVHHINEIKDDNRLENLQVMSKGDHKRHHTKPVEIMVLVCTECKKTFHAFAYRIRQNQIKQNKKGPFCNKSCAAKWIWHEQQKLGQLTFKSHKIAIHGSHSMYNYHKCRCDICTAGNTQRKRNYVLKKSLALELSSGRSTAEATISRIV